MFATALFSGFRAILTKTVNKNERSFTKALMTNTQMFAFAFVIVLLSGILSVSTFFYVPFWLAVVYGVSMVLAQVCLMKAVELGPVSTSSLIYNCGLIIAVLFGSVYYHETVNALHILGIALILLSFVFSVKKEDKSASTLWFLTALGGCVFGGSMGIWQKVFRNEYAEYNLDNFIQVSFLIMVVFSFFLATISALLEKNRTQKRVDREPPEQQETQSKTQPARKKRIQLGLVAALGASMGLINIINTFLSGVLPSVIVFPCIYGGGIIATSVLSVLIFKERPTNMQKLSLLVGILGIIAIGIGSMLV